jgi:NADH-quinone oxidoreductase subunit E
MRGKYHIKVCLGTACHVRGARKLVDTIRGIVDRSEEGRFSLETVNCVGACALGPVMVVNEEIHGNVTLDKVDELLASYGGK